MSEQCYRLSGSGDSVELTIAFISDLALSSLQPRAVSSPSGPAVLQTSSEPDALHTQMKHENTTANINAATRVVDPMKWNSVFETTKSLTDILAEAEGYIGVLKDSANVSPCVRPKILIQLWHQINPESKLTVDCLGRSRRVSVEFSE